MPLPHNTATTVRAQTSAGSPFCPPQLSGTHLKRPVISEGTDRPLTDLQAQGLGGRKGQLTTKPRAGLLVSHGSGKLPEGPPDAGSDQTHPLDPRASGTAGHFQAAGRGVWPSACPPALRLRRGHQGHMSTRQHAAPGAERQGSGLTHGPSRTRFFPSGQTFWRRTMQNGHPA